MSDVNKALVIILIILICLASFDLLLKIFFKSGESRRPKSIIIIGMTLGDIVLALFSLVVRATRFFDSFSQNDCIVGIVADMYQIFFIHFLYSAGIIALAAELVLRHKQKDTSLGNSSVWKALFFGVIPWVITFAFVIPLVLVGADWKACLLSESRAIIQARFSILVILPVILSLITSLNLVFIGLPPPSQDGVRGRGRGLNNLAYMPYSVDDAAPNDLQNDNQFEYLDDASNYNEGKDTDLMQTNSQAFDDLQLSLQQSSVNGDSTELSNTNSTSAKPHKENVVLLEVALVHFFFVLPQAIYYIENGSTSGSAVGFEIVFWLANFRSVITPVIWSKVFKAEETDTTLDFHVDN